ncbi:MAG: FMN-binding protein [Deltaproteobacteria bacterium]|nr:FMN-binding protein [Deltaproteobacteria bacterium]
MKEIEKRQGNKEKIALLIVLFTLTLLPDAALSKVYSTREEALKSAFPQADKIDKKIIRLNEEQKHRISQKSGQAINFSYKSVYIAEKNGKRLGYAIVDQVKGKSSFIKYLLAIAPEGTIRNIVILTYRGTKGAEVRHDRFREQFIGKRENDPLQLGVDIDAIAGATVSSRSIAEGVRKLMSFWHEGFGLIQE